VETGDETFFRELDEQSAALDEQVRADLHEQSMRDRGDGMNRDDDLY